VPCRAASPEHTEEEEIGEGLTVEKEGRHGGERRKTQRGHRVKRRKRKEEKRKNKGRGKKRKKKRK
jgi:hypothetical protein